MNKGPNERTYTLFSGFFVLVSVVKLKILGTSVLMASCFQHVSLPSYKNKVCNEKPFLPRTSNHARHTESVGSALMLYRFSRLGFDLTVCFEWKYPRICIAVHG